MNCGSLSLRPRLYSITKGPLRISFLAWEIALFMSFLFIITVVITESCENINIMILISCKFVYVLNRVSTLCVLGRTCLANYWRSGHEIYRSTLVINQVGTPLLLRQLWSYGENWFSSSSQFYVQKVVQL